MITPIPRPEPRELERKIARVVLILIGVSILVPARLGGEHASAAAAV